METLKFAKEISPRFGRILFTAQADNGKILEIQANGCLTSDGDKVINRFLFRYNTYDNREDYEFGKAHIHQLTTRFNTDNMRYQYTPTNINDIHIFNEEMSARGFIEILNEATDNMSVDELIENINRGELNADKIFIQNMICNYLSKSKD